MRRLGLVVMAVVMQACPGPVGPCGQTVCPGDASVPVDAGQPVGDGGATTDAGAVDAGGPPLEGEAECAHLKGGPSTDAGAAQFAAAHGGVRFFGPFTLYSRADDVLATVLDAEGPIDESTLMAYGRALPGVCVVRADDSPMPQASVELRGSVAVLHPGLGSLRVPEGSTAVVIDLRGLPARPELKAALEGATTVALKGALARASREVRIHSGPSDEFAEQNVYANMMGPLMLDPWPGSAGTQLPLAVITEAVSAPLVAELAGTLRLTNRAWLFGAAVSASVAESTWQGFGHIGIGYRSMNLQYANLQWPDAIAADVGPDGLDAAVLSLASRGGPSAPSGALARPALMAIDSKGAGPGTAVSRGSVRAALVTLHATMRRFYPYFAQVGDGLDARLVETLASVDDAGVVTRQGALNTVRRFGEVIHDGHNFIDDLTGQLPVAGYFPVIVDHTDAGPTIAKSLAPGVNPGDVITSIAGTATDVWYATELPRTAGATRGYQLDLASRRYTELSGPTQFGLRATDGGTRTVTVTPASVQVFQQVYTTGAAHARRLTAEGAADIEYINLDAAGLTSTNTCAAALTESQGAAGVVLDMRGYPGSEGFDCVARFAQSRIYSPRFVIPTWSGPETYARVAVDSWSLEPVSPGFSGPVVLIVGPVTVSAAETISTMLVDAARLKKVVGRQSAGTNGNITYTRVPGGISFSFTGMETLHTDGGVYHGRGIVPDLEVVPTPDDFATGRDRAIEAAIAALRAP